MPGLDTRQLRHYNATQMRLTLPPFARLMLALALFVALASSGFAHRFTSDAADESLMAYLAAGGTYQNICGEAGSGDHNASWTCDACRLVDSVALPPAAISCDATPAVILATNSAFAAIPSLPFVADPSRPVRAPPLV
jgi:hypothetical protein